MLSRIMGRSSADASVEEAASEEARQPRVGMVVDMADANWVGAFVPTSETEKFAYARPEWLYLVSADELAVSGDQTTRPVLVPKDPRRMPLNAGYAETINAGKTPRNEDQASARVLSLVEKVVEEDAAGPSTAKAKSVAPTPCPGRKFKTSQAAASASADPGVEVLPPPPLGGPDSESETEEEAAASQPLASLNDDPLLCLTSPTSERGPAFPGSPELIRADAYCFGLFDGHAGTGAALMASACLHEHIRERLSQVLGTLVHLDAQESALGFPAPVLTPNGKRISRDQLVVGALETAFVEMDDQIAEEKQQWRIPGGCAVVVAVFLLGKLYVANAGDCRALLVPAHGPPTPMSQDLQPETERKRIQLLAFRQPELLGKQFSRLEYNRHLGRRDLKSKVLYRDWYMDGWAMKTVRDTDLRAPLISDGFRKVRLLNTIGVTRGFGDHHLMTLDDRIPIKPFLSPVPEVRAMELGGLASLGPRDVLVLASDGLWDVLSNQAVADLLRASFDAAEDDDPMMYTLAAQELVIAARGDPTGPGGRWQLSGGSVGREAAAGRAAPGEPLGKPGHASTDDISVFVIPLKHSLTPPTPDDDDEPLLLQP